MDSPPPETSDTNALKRSLIQKAEIRDLTEKTSTKFLRALPLIIYSVVTILALSICLGTRTTKAVPTIYVALVLMAFLVPLLWVAEAQEKPKAWSIILLTGLSLCASGMFVSTIIRINQSA